MSRLIKICGLSTEESIDVAIDAGASHIGLVHFEKSPRHVDLPRAAQLRQYAAGRIKTVLLLVNADPRLTAEAYQQIQPDIIQFHGTETPEWLALVHKAIPAELWKALGVQGPQTLQRSLDYDDAVDRILYDAPAVALPGGTGTSFDWGLISGFDHQIPWALAGGLNLDNIITALMQTNAPMVDISSGVESEPGKKDMDKIRQFCQAVHSFDKEQNSD
ncbi:N-(5'-phosphoribosyl)anthranilate isomerase [Sphingorhabdus lutea]|uniref:N-(5'-phosphoribosyl)anthranilate isomerase n=1 Tax=Sphingorhabdus lutea TaxID=1913578 RepID=A0A1L3JBL3_9SPHN|nr:phosphoribosylanthranilate isomerase [Sphingorhabdus lutea]APG62534.1 N-(5'-phosphoribosyl)anthranilate isomerase [Sphingorhabdus lutea]